MIFNSSLTFALAAALLIATSGTAWAAEGDDAWTVPVLIGSTILIGLVTSYLLYRAARANRELIIRNAAQEARKLFDQPSQDTLSPEDARPVQIPPELAADEKSAQTINKLVEEHTRERVQEIKQEYSIKYQLAVQEREKELKLFKRDLDTMRKSHDQMKQENVQVRTEAKQTEAVVKGASEGLVILNQKGEVVFMNESAQKILETDGSKKMGRPILENLPEKAMVSLARSGGAAGQPVVESTSKDENVKRVLRASTAVIQDDSGKTLGMLNVLSDVTQQKELEQAKKNLLSNITHEIRTPIVAMQKSALVLTSRQIGALNEAQANCLDIVVRNLDRLSRLVEDMLDAASIEAGKLRIRFSLNRIEKTVSDTCDLLEQWVRSKKITLVREIEKNLPEFMFDADKVSQALSNLISNAIKFTPAGGTITVKAVCEPTGNAVLISVADTGVGISKENFTKLFKRFEQFGEQAGITGTGLGLSITKEIIERHGGTIAVESELNKGSVFTLSLPTKQKVAGGQT